MNEILNKNFLVELFGACFKPAYNDLLQVVVKEVKPIYLPTEEYKQILRALQIGYNTLNKAPSLPALSQKFSDDLEVLSLIEEIIKVKEVDGQQLLEELEKFNKEREFLKTYDELADLWNKGDKETAYKMLLTTADKINNYSLTQSSFTPVFSGMNHRHQARIVASNDKGGKETRKVPLNISEQDDILHGGMDRGDTYLYIGGSGRYKSTALRYHGYSAAKQGFTVVHFQAEDTKETTLNLYDSALLGESLYNVESANVTDKKINALITSLKKANFEGGEIYLKAFEKFSGANLADCIKLLNELRRQVGQIHLIIFDYLELFDPSDGVKYSANDSRQKRESIANKMKNIAMEFDSAVLTATQSSDLSQDLLDDEDFVLTRNHISEFKGLVKPFSGVFTLNQTRDESENGVMRIYNDKFRKYPSRQIVKIGQSVNIGRFYSQKKTIEFGFYKSRSILTEKEI